MASHIRCSLLRTGLRNYTSSLLPADGWSPLNLKGSVRHLSRMRTKTGNKGGFWIDRMAPPLFEKSLIEQKLEENPDSRFDIVAPARIYQSSSVFYDPLLVKFTNMIMYEGNKRLAEQIMADCFTNIKTIQLEKYFAADDFFRQKIVLNPFKIFHSAVENCKPVLALAPLRRGGVTYQIPVSVTDKQAEWTSMKWLILAARDHDPKSDRIRAALARELIAASNNEGKVIKRKFDLHKQCEANKAYAHYRWSR